MGTVKAMRRFFQDAEKVMTDRPHDGSDQGVVSELFGLQEYGREVLRQQYLERQPIQRLTLRIKNTLFGRSPYDRDRDTVLDADAGRERPLVDLHDRIALEAMEYGIGLDYGSELSHTTVNSVRDADWITFSAPPDTPSRYWHMVSPHPTSLPADLARSPPPPPLPLINTTTTWSDLPLYTHLRTGSVPVSIHHNEFIRGLKKLRTRQWGQMWWNRDARALLDAHIRGPMRPVAVTTTARSEDDDDDDDAGKLQEWWSPSPVKGGAMADSGLWIDWNDLCGEYQGALFPPQDHDDNDTGL